MATHWSPLSVGYRILRTGRQLATHFLFWQSFKIKGKLNYLRWKIWFIFGIGVMKQTNDSLNANWIAMFDCLRHTVLTEVNDSLALEITLKCIANPWALIRSCMRTDCVSYIWFYDLVTKNLYLVTIFYHVVAKWPRKDLFISSPDIREIALVF